MGSVAQEMVEKAGVDRRVLIDKLVAAAGAEFTTFYYPSVALPRAGRPRGWADRCRLASRRLRFDATWAALVFGAAGMLVMYATGLMTA